MIAFWGVKVYKEVFPDYQTEFSIVNGASLVILVCSSIYVSSVIVDKYEEKYPQTKGK
jgi:hypothetical protein